MIQRLLTSRLGFNRGIEVLFFTLILWGAAFFETLCLIKNEWSGAGAYNHGFLSVGIALFICWENRQRLTPLRSKPALIPLLLLLASGALWWAGRVANTAIVQQLATFLVLYFAMASLFPLLVFRHIQIAFLVILFALPVWGSLQVPLREASTYVGFELLKLLGIAVLRSNYAILVPGGSFVVEKACSGLSFFLAAITLSLMFGYFNKLSIFRILLLSIVTAIVSMVANWIRILSIMLVGNYYGMEHPIVQDHLTFGWVIFAGTLLPMYWIANKFFVAEIPLINRGNLVFDSESTQRCEAGKSISYPLLLLVSLSMILFPTLFVTLKDRGVMTSRAIPFPDSVDSWIASNRAFRTEWRPHFVGVDTEQFRSYSNGSVTVRTYLGSYFSQEQEKELIYFDNFILDESQWNQAHAINVDGLFDCQWSVLTNTAGLKRTLCYWYVVGGKHAKNEKTAKLLEIYGFMRGNRSASVIALMIESGDYPTETEIRLVNDLAMELEQSLLPQFNY